MKPVWQSKTFWANLIALGATLSLTMGLDLGLTAEVQAQILAGVMAVLNVYLRFVTTTGVKLK
jgi:hypothetical protein